MASDLIHIVDDDAAVRDALGRLFRAEGLAVRLHASAEALLGILNVEPAGCVITDLHMPGMTGLQLIARLRSDGVEAPCILVTGRVPPTITPALLAELRCELMEKPFGPDEMVAAVRRALGEA